MGLQVEYQHQRAVKIFLFVDLYTYRIMISYPSEIIPREAKNVRMEQNLSEVIRMEGSYFTIGGQVYQIDHYQKFRRMNQ
jgi:hypothetical protein